MPRSIAAGLPTGTGSSVYRMPYGRPVVPDE